MPRKLLKKISRLGEGYNIFEKIFWAFILLMSFYGMSIYSYLTFQRYVSDPISMTLDTEYIHWNFSFPAASICLLKGKGTQPLQSTIRKLNISYKGSEINFLRTVHNCMFTNPNQPDTVFAKCDELSNKYGINVPELKKKFLPKSCNVFVDFLYYNEELYNCTDVLKLHITELGYCFIANSIIDYGYNSQNLKLEYTLSTKSMRLSIRLRVFKLWQYALYVHSPEELPLYNSISKEIYSTDTLYSYNVEQITIDKDAAEKSIHERGCRFPHEKLNGSPFHYRMYGFLSNTTGVGGVQLYAFHIPINLLEIYSSLYCNLSGIMCLSKGDINNKALLFATEKNICVPSCIEQILKYAGQSEIRSETDTTFTDISIDVSNFPTARYKRAITHTKLDLSVSIAGLAGLFFGVSVLNFVEVIYYLVTAK